MDSVVCNDTDCLCVFVLIPDVFHGQAILEDLVFNLTHFCLLDGKTSQWHSLLVGFMGDMEEDSVDGILI